MINAGYFVPLTQSSKVNDVGGLVFFEQLVRLSGISCRYQVRIMAEALFRYVYSPQVTLG